MSRMHNRLSQVGVNSAKLGMHADGGGLYLQVTVGAGGRLNKSWLFRYAIDKRERQMGLGSLVQVKLADARQKAAECRRLRLGGIDPIDARETALRVAEEGVVTFQRAFDMFFATKRKSLSNAKHAEQWRSTMEAYGHLEELTFDAPRRTKSSSTSAMPLGEKAIIRGTPMSFHRSGIGRLRISRRGKS